MTWLLHEIASRDKQVDMATLSTHDTVHGLGAKWREKLHAKTGFGYGPPTTQACIRALTQQGATSVYKFLTGEHEAALRERGELARAARVCEAAQPLRQKLAAEFGEGWRAVCFGRASYFLSHSWDRPFKGLIEAVQGLPASAFVWCDTIAINRRPGCNSNPRSPRGVPMIEPQ